MSKANRGKGTFERYNRGKGTCGDLRSGSRRKKVFGVQAVQSGHRAR